MFKIQFTTKEINKEMKYYNIINYNNIGIDKNITKPGLGKNENAAVPHFVICVSLESDKRETLNDRLIHVLTALHSI